MKGNAMGDMAQSGSASRPPRLITMGRLGLLAGTGGLALAGCGGGGAASGSPSAAAATAKPGCGGVLTAQIPGGIRRTKTTIQSPTAVERYAATNSFKASVGASGYKLVSY
jgi:hypothetical protein